MFFASDNNFLFPVSTGINRGERKGGSHCHAVPREYGD